MNAWSRVLAWILMLACAAPGAPRLELGWLCLETGELLEQCCCLELEVSDCCSESDKQQAPSVVDQGCDCCTPLMRDCGATANVFARRQGNARVAACEFAFAPLAWDGARVDSEREQRIDRLLHGPPRPSAALQTVLRI